MPERCKFEPASEYENWCTTHDKSQLECVNENLRRLTEFANAAHECMRHTGYFEDGPASLTKRKGITFYGAATEDPQAIKDWQAYGPVLQALYERGLLERGLTSPVDDASEPPSKKKPARSKPNLADAVEWNRTLSKVKALGNVRFKAEQKRLRKLGIIDKNGRATSKKLPADMRPDPGRTPRPRGETK